MGRSSRRQFLTGTSAALLAAGLPGGRVLARPAQGLLRFVFVFAQGGWDPTRVFAQAVALLIAPPRPAPKEAPAKPKEKPAPPKKATAKTPAQPKPAAEKQAAKAKPKPEKPTPKPAAAAPAKSSSKAKKTSDAPAKASGAGKADKPRGSLLGKDFLKGIDTSADAPRKAAPPPAAAMGPAQKSALDAEIRRQLKPHWRPPSGADADQLVTLLEVRLDKSGALVGTPQVIDQLGVTASNRPQAKLHAERAIQAVKLAAPFRNLPPEFYDQWKWLRPLRFDARLNR